MKNLALENKGMLFGIIGAIIGTFPNVFLKTILAYSDYGQFCFDSFHIEIWGDLWLTPCGITSVFLLGGPFWVSLLLIFLGGALFGFLGARIGYKKAEKSGYNLGKENWGGSFWWSFIGGILFDLLFIFMVIYPGQ